MATFPYEKIKRYMFPYIDSNMYVLAEHEEALVIDPHISAEAEQYLEENKVRKVTVLLTHEHFDHTCGIPWFRAHYDTRVICQKEALDERRQKHFCRPMVVSLLLADRGEDEKIKELESEYAPHVIRAEQTFTDEMDVAWQNHVIHMEHLPGHSPASSLIMLDDAVVFTGDSLIPDTEPTIRWPWSDEKAYREKAVPELLRIPGTYMVYPGHREVAKMADLSYTDGMFVRKPGI